MFEKETTPKKTEREKRWKERERGSERSHLYVILWSSAFGHVDCTGREV